MKKLLFFFPEKCTGCRVCESMCSLTHTGEINPARSRIRVFKSEKDGTDLPMTCLQCEDALCAKACPVGAIKLDPITGAQVTDTTLCFNCRMCVIACPFGGTLVDIDNRIMRCDLCGGDPQCVKFCETKAIEFLTPDEIVLARLKQTSMGPLYATGGLVARVAGSPGDGGTQLLQIDGCR